MHVRGFAGKIPDVITTASNAAATLFQTCFITSNSFGARFRRTLFGFAAADILTAVGYIQNNHTRKISVESIANMMHVDRTYLCKRFKKKIGCSMQQCILDMRIMTAIRLIERGLNAPSNFTKIFTREVGKTPTEWKQFLLDNFEAYCK